nr:hypothetical protein [Tanacetum cinerariifolium]
MASPVVLPEIALEVKAAVVALPTAVLVHGPNSPFWRVDPGQLASLKVRLTVLDLVIKTGLEVKPFEASPSPDYVPTSLIHAPASSDYHPRSDTVSEPFKDESEPIEDDAPERTKPLLAQVAPPPPVQITPTSRTEPASIGPSRKRCKSLPPASAVPPPVVLSPCKRMLLPQLDTSDEVVVLHGLLGIAGLRIADLEIQAKDAEDRLEQYELGLIHDRARIQRLKEHLNI